MVEDIDYIFEGIEKDFGKDVVLLVDVVIKLSKF